MNNSLPIPDELQHLIEKREREQDRRQDDARRDDDRDRRTLDLGPIGAVESADSLDDIPAEDRRSTDDRRENLRREKLRRKDDIEG